MSRLLFFLLFFIYGCSSINTEPKYTINVFEEDNPKILAAIIATGIGIATRNIIATIFSGLASYWFLIFVV